MRQSPTTFKVDNLDHAHAAEAGRQLRAALEALNALPKGGSGRVTLEFDTTEGLDLAGIQLLVALNRSLASLDREAGAADRPGERLSWNWGRLAGRVRSLCAYAGLDPAQVGPGLEDQAPPGPATTGGA